MLKQSVKGTTILDIHKASILTLYHQSPLSLSLCLFRLLPAHFHSSFPSTSHPQVSFLFLPPTLLTRTFQSSPPPQVRKASNSNCQTYKHKPLRYFQRSNSDYQLPTQVKTTIISHPHYFKLIFCPLLSNYSTKTVTLIFRLISKL